MLKQSMCVDSRSCTSWLL